MFVNENVNPKKHKVADCVVRAIAKAEGKSWLEIFDTLTDLARKEYSVLNDKKVYGKYLSKYEKIPVMYEDHGRKFRYTVEMICGWKGTYIVSIANHLTVVKDGKYYDIWDCGDRSSYIIWKVR